ncbi:MAG: GcrA family cell cycle regulator [Alphaproteobacteria bacterium]|nr:GcrA family cell cycle regulator [Alphaproteobacteria bacterium]
MDWSDEKIEELRRLWNEGLTTAEIGRRLNVSKNAVVGKAHRLDLAKRPSPIKYQNNEVQEENVERKKDTKKATPKAKVVVKKAPVKKKFITMNDLTRTSCRWPFGDPKEEDFHFCGKECLPDKPYCAEHCAIAYDTSKRFRQ